MSAMRGKADYIQQGLSGPFVTITGRYWPFKLDRLVVDLKPTQQSRTHSFL